MINPNMTNLAKYLGRTRAGLYQMKKDKPKQFKLLWNGWLEHCKNTGQ